MIIINIPNRLATYGASRDVPTLVGGGWYNHLLGQVPSLPLILGYKMYSERDLSNDVKFRRGHNLSFLGHGQNWQIMNIDGTKLSEKKIEHTKFKLW